MKPSSPSLPIAGIIPFSATDWPGNITVSIFTQGCPLRCGYCHNPTLQPMRPTTLTLDDALLVAQSRRTLIDGVVISGGEPLMHAGLPAAIAKLHAAGFAVGLHTSGFSPAKIRTLVASPATTPDWIGLDIKAMPQDMELVIQRPGHIGNRVWESLAILQAAEVDLQVRTTVWSPSPVQRHLDQLIEKVKGYGLQLVVQQARDANGNPWHPESMASA
ncbi:anaerobic ribonucleoside-triphosphate reductase activating protein [Corynebacterium sp. HS2168-gen11]|uniref:anaerobic ribonucleoside-triphosphate reductase activating protein n=1 Tax=Corynebacterium sp. HS2168-gen11 TaxID=2974027 RepID=UPI00216ACE06|nr:anaerobic ribonucleoside-triphosphate reductase activating protein [Corynebacterium sp. HS2168-gen11]MCS4535731.1 anaerobic ribonucleoside-triphosphate reductase activating protein [Corynebacterium sp. HS2168-gen11]